MDYEVKKVLVNLLIEHSSRFTMSNEIEFAHSLIECTNQLLSDMPPTMKVTFFSNVAAYFEKINDE